MQWIRDHTPNPEREKAFHIALIITLGANVLLTIVKAIAAYCTNSVALYAETANSLSDVVYSVAFIFALNIALKPPDLTHPQGHARFEPMVGLLVALMIAIAGYEAMRSSIGRFISGGSRIEAGLPTIVLLVTAGLKTAMFLIISRLAKTANSPALRAAAKDNLTDVLSSGAAFVGILASFYIHPLMDPITGFIISLLIFKTAYDAGHENFKYLTGAGPDEELRKKIVEIAGKVEGEHTIHHMVSEYVGPKLVIDMHINLPGEASVEEAHDVAERISTALESLPDVDRAYVHVEPNEE